MSAWLKAYESLPEASKVNVQRWIHLNKFIAHTLEIDERVWFEEYLGWAMQNPLDYSFMESCFPDFDPAAAGESFVRGGDPGAPGAKVPLRAKNNLGRLSPELQDAIAKLLEAGGEAKVPVLPSDVAHLQKIFANEKALAKLKRPDFRNVSIARDGDRVAIVLASGEALLGLGVDEFTQVMSRPLL